MPSTTPTGIYSVAILMPLLVGTIAVLATTVVHALVVSAILSFVRHERRRGRAGASFSIDVFIVTVAILLAFAAHLLEITIWAALFMLCGEFAAFGNAFDHSAVNYSTLGYGNVVMTPSWRLLGPLEAADGMLMFGVSTAMIFAVIHRLVLARFADLRDWETTSEPPARG
jgi:hypothetical protein